MNVVTENGAVDRVRAHTSPEVNERVDEQTKTNVRQYAARSKEEISRRIEELDREWDIERWLEMNASSIAFTGLALGIAVNKKWFFVPALVLPFLFQHAVQGWCPPLPVLRRLGVRTRREIDAERFALKMLRGDFETAQTVDDPEQRGVEIWKESQA